MMSAPESYARLTEELKRLDCFKAVAGLLEWDELVNLPPESADYRARQMAHFSELAHRETIRPELGQWIEQCEKNIEGLDERQRVVVREARKDYDRETRLPPAFVSRRSAARSRAYHAWVQARAESKFERFQPFLEEQLDLARQEAGYAGWQDRPYDYWLDRFDPGLNADAADRLFNELNAGLPALAQRILESTVHAPTEIFHGFPVDRQERFVRQMVSRLGFDFNRGRLDRSVHPFCSGNALDLRMTTRYFVDNPLDSLTSAIHETGHALYEQGLPKEHVGTALGEAAGMAVHESQSRLWENQVGRSRAFWKYWEPVYRETFPEALKEVSSEDFYLALNAVRATPIRVDSDEVTYNLHILLRFRLERQLFAGKLKVRELPEAWNELSKELLGLTPSSAAEGVLQDVHWSGGGFGYFPSYCLGNMLAAQLWFAAREQLTGLDEALEDGEYGLLLDWLRARIHQFGKQFNALELTRQATGEDLSAAPLMRYLRERYLPLYEGSSEAA